MGRVAVPGPRSRTGPRSQTKHGRGVESHHLATDARIGDGRLDRGPRGDRIVVGRVGAEQALVGQGLGRCPDHEHLERAQQVQVRVGVLLRHGDQRHGGHPAESPHDEWDVRVAAGELRMGARVLLGVRSEPVREDGRGAVIGCDPQDRFDLAACPPAG